jgi:hypothetical protein
MLRRPPSVLLGVVISPVGATLCGPIPLTQFICAAVLAYVPPTWLLLVISVFW